MTKRRRKATKIALKAISVAIILSIKLLVNGVQAQAFASSTVPCPGNSGLTGYTNIEAMNADTDAEIARIENGSSPSFSYFFLLCPGTTFSTEDIELAPKLNRATYSCGQSGDISEGCILSGGLQNVRIRPPEVQGYVPNDINFKGITFENFSRESVNLRGIAPTEAVFTDCLWQAFSSDQIFRIRNNNGDPAMSLTVRTSTIKGLTETPAEDANANTGFLNEGGKIQISSLTVENVAIGNMIKTESGGQTIISDSIFTNSMIGKVTQTKDQGTTEINEIEVSSNTEMTTIFDVDGAGVSTSLRKVVVSSNTGTDTKPLTILKVRRGANAELIESRIENNKLIEHVVVALGDGEGSTSQSYVLIRDTDITSNVGVSEDFISRRDVIVMSQEFGASIEMIRNQFQDNTNFLANIAAFFGGFVSFSHTCFIRNTIFIVGIILEESDFEASMNYVEDDESTVCNGEDPVAGVGRLAVEKPGEFCFRGGNSDEDGCVVECLRNTNDQDTCTAKIISEWPSLSPTVSNEPTTSSPPTLSAAPSHSPSLQPTMSSQPTVSSPPMEMQPSTSQQPSLSLSPTPQPTSSVQPSTSSVPSNVLTLSPTVSPSLSMSPSSSTFTSIPEPTGGSSDLPYLGRGVGKGGKGGKGFFGRNESKYSKKGINRGKGFLQKGHLMKKSKQKEEKSKEFAKLSDSKKLSKKSFKKLSKKGFQKANKTTS